MIKMALLIEQLPFQGPQGFCWNAQCDVVACSSKLFMPPLFTIHLEGEITLSMLNLSIRLKLDEDPNSLEVKVAAFRIPKAFIQVALLFGRLL